MPNEYEQYFASRFNTKLSDENEKRFATWVAQQSEKRGRDLSKDMADYDLKGYWLNGGYKDSGDGHMPDTYKKPNHPTFSDQSKYSGTPSDYGGTWQGGTWADNDTRFTPSKHMLTYTHPTEWLKEYMKTNEPGVRLALPPTRPSS